MMMPGWVLARNLKGGGGRSERPVWPRLLTFIGLSLLVHAFFAQVRWQLEVPAAPPTERLIVSLLPPAEEPPPLPSPRPSVPRPKPVVQPKPVAQPKPTPPALGIPTETPAAVESPEATVETDGSPLGEEDGGHAGEMEDLVKRIQKKAAPPPGELSLTRATPRVETNPRPQYPALARANHWHGIVQLQVGVSDEGRVERIEVVRSSGHDVLDEAAINAVRYWRFVPARRGEEAVADSVVVSIQLPLKK